MVITLGCGAEKLKADVDCETEGQDEDDAKHMDCTTDITRNVHFGKPIEHERRCYTARKNTLLKDYKGSRKSSFFVDKRIGEQVGMDKKSQVVPAHIIILGEDANYMRSCNK